MCVFVWYNRVCVCEEEKACVPLPLWGQTQRQNGGPWRNCCQKGSRGVCGNQWDDGSGLSCASHLESSPLISEPETLANQFSPANKYYVGWQNSSVQMSCRTRCCFKLWMAALPCGPRPARPLYGPRENPDCVSEPITLFINCFWTKTSWLFLTFCQLFTSTVDSVIINLNQTEQYVSGSFGVQKQIFNSWRTLFLS